jgi:Complex 1 protein (LYR family)
VHIYRTLLRECTYLPDPNSRGYIKSWVQDAFRRYLPRDPTKVRCKPVEINPKQEIVVLHKARQLSQLLRRANEGYPTPFEKVLKWTYGRIGERRHFLTSQLLKQEDVEGDTGEHQKGRKLPKIVTELLKTQLKHSEYLEFSRKKKPQPLGPDIPATNAWGRPMPEVRLKNQWQKWYESSLKKMLPPLSDSEFDEIKSVASGERVLKPRSRRTKASAAVFSAEPDDCESLLSRTESQKYHRERPHRLTKRFVARRMQTLLMHVPTLRTVSGAKGSNASVVVKWDRIERHQNKIEEPNAVQADALFG